jgi:hypothetical protein
LLVGLAAWALTWSPAFAAPTPPTPVAPLRSFTGHAHADLKIVAGSSPINFTAHVTIAQRNMLSRFDIILDRGQAALLPIGSVTLVIDRAANTLTAWNAATKLSFTQPLTPMLPSAATPAPSAGATVQPRSPLADLDVFTMSVQLGSHSTVAGLATTGLIVSIDVRKKGTSATAHVHATMDLADDDASFPVDFRATIDPGIPGVTGSLDYAIDDVVQVEPPSSIFVVPAGYQKAATLLGILSKGTPALPIL